MARLLLLFILVPAVELALLIELGRHVGVVATLAVIALTGILGAYLARRQGLGVLRQVQSEMAAGRIPAGPIFDGVVILLAGAVLMTPGIITDVVGFLCLIPKTRGLIKNALRRRIERAIREGRMTVSMHFPGQGEEFSREPPRDVEPESDTRDSPVEPPGGS